MLPADPPRRPLTSRLPLWVIILLSALGYVALAVWFPLAANVGRTPPGDIRTFAPTLPGGLLYALLLILLYVLMLVAFGRVAGSVRNLSLVVLIVVAALFALPLLFAYPVNATDVFRYVIRGRVAAAYGENPYVMPPSGFAGDPFLPLAGEWAGETSPYGPLWELIAAGLTSISGDDLLLGVVLFKLLALACFLASAALLWSLLGDRPRRAALALLWAWNPALLLTFVLNGHNDALMVFWLLLGVWVARKGRLEVGFLLLCLAALTKPAAVLALPVFFLAFWRWAAPRRARFVAVSLAGALALVWLTFLPWARPGSYWQTPLELSLRLAREATGSAGFSPAVWFYFALGQRVSIEAIGSVLRGLFVLFAAGVLWRGWRGRSPLRGTADIFFGYLFQALSFRIWYVVWPFPWLVLDAGATAGQDDAGRAAAYRLRAGLWFLLAAQLSVIWYGHVRVFVLGGDQVAAHLVGVPLVFGLPWLLTRLPLGPQPA